MKKMKKMLSLLLVLSMVLSMSFASAFADDGNGGLICTKTEHTHGESCYDENHELICGFEEEHQHDEGCYAVKEVEENDTSTADGTGTEPETEAETPAEVQAFLDAVVVLPDASEVTADNAEAIGVQVNAVLDMADALSEDNYAREDVTDALTAVYAVYEAVLAAEEIEESNTFETNTIEFTPSDASNPENTVVMTPDSNGVYSVNANGTVTVNGTVTGRIVVTGGTVEITGTGTIDAGNFNKDGSENPDGLKGSVLTVEGGANVTLSSGVTIKGGTGTKSAESGVSKEEETSGGGVLVKNGSFTMNRGTITGNKASRGGGIYVAHSGRLTINGGEISGNVATGVDRQYEHLPIGSTNEGGAGPGNFGGGGIWINGTAEINPTSVNIVITGNKSMTTTDLGGGGIYVNNEGELNMYNVVIKKNSAKGLGGGLATCIHGRLKMVDVNGAAIYSNTALNDDTVRLKSAYGSFTDGNDKWAEDTDFKSNATDVLASGTKTTEKDFGTIITNARFDGQVHNWKGYVKKNDSDTTFEKIDETNNDAVYSGCVLGLTAQNKTDVDTTNRTVVLISDNTSESHGGGIACNGIMTLGTQPQDAILNSIKGDLKVNVKKELVGGILKGGEFTFGLFNNPDDNDDNSISTAKNDENGDVKLFFTNEIKTADLSENGCFNRTFYIREIDKSSKYIDCDDSVYKVDVEIECIESVSETMGNLTLITKNYSITSTMYTKGHMVYSTNENGEEATWQSDKDSVESDVTPTFNNIALGSLKIDKKVISSTPLQDGESFQFTVTLKDATGAPVTGTFSGYDFDKDGNATVTISGFDVNTAQGSDGKWTDTQSVTIEGIPAGTQYTVVETPSSSKDYDVTYGGNYSDRAEGNIPAGNVSEAKITNTMKHGSLTIDKTVVSDTPLRENEQFDFIVTLKDVNGNPVTGEFSGYEFNEAGEATVTISGFEAQDENGRRTAKKSVTINGLPAGTTYTVTETDESRGRYTATYGNSEGANGQTGSIAAGADSKVEITNAYTYTPYVPPVTPTPEDPTTPPTEIDDPDTPLAPGPDEPVVDIDDPDTPLAPAAPDEPVTEIDEEEPPLAGAPKTGDDFQLWTWIALVMASGAGLAWLALTDRKRKNAVK